MIFYQGIIFLTRFVLIFLIIYPEEHSEILNYFVNVLHKFMVTHVWLSFLKIVFNFVDLYDEGQEIQKNIQIISIRMKPKLVPANYIEEIDTIE
jgi:hypothetical protein